VQWKKRDAAESLLKEGLEGLPDNIRAKLILADFLANQRSFGAAESALTSFVAEAPDQFALRFALAELFRREDKLSRAIEVITVAVAHGSEDSATKLGAMAVLASLYFADGQLPEAKSTVNKVLESEPMNPQGLLLRSRIQLKEGALDEAIASLRTVLRGAPQSVVALGLLSRAFLQSIRSELATDTLTQLLDIAPGNLAVRVQLAQIVASRGQFETALAHVNDALERSANYVPALATKADPLVGLGRLDQAKEVGAKIGGLPKGDIVALKLEGRIARAGGKPEEALEAFKKIRELDSDDWLAVNGIVQSFSGLKDLDGAEALLRDVVDKEPDHQRAWMRLGDVYRVQQNGGSSTYGKLV
jgi:predicted Zn-dependent protease